MTVQNIISEAKKSMNGAVAHTKEEFGNIRTGRANPALFANVTAEYYGTPTPLQQLASFAVPEARKIVITPFDKSAISAIEHALQVSDLGVQASREGDVIRVSLPELTGERRQEYAKLAKTRAEDGKVAVRGGRHKALDAISKAVKDGEVGKDEGERAEGEIEKLTKQFVSQIDEGLAKKEEEILEV